MIQVLARVGSPPLLHHFVLLAFCTADHGSRLEFASASRCPSRTAAQKRARASVRRSSSSRSLLGAMRPGTPIALPPRRHSAPQRRANARQRCFHISRSPKRLRETGFPATSPTARRGPRFFRSSSRGSVAPVRFLLSESAPSTRG
jgi:hypothetical protein